MEQKDRFKALPSVDAVLQRLGNGIGEFPRSLVVQETRAVIERRRKALAGGREATGESVEEEVRRRLESLLQPSLRRVINATGVILHTNLGRAPLGAWAPVCGYSNLEYDLSAGSRGKRDVHVSGWLERLLGCPGMVVNNNAAAVFLALHELAAGGEVVISRGELIEIGEGFRIPEIMQRSGVVLREVGTTNRTHIDDYRDAINERTRLLMRVHRSNFRLVGFTAQPPLEQLAALARERSLPLYEDLGSGCVVDLRPYGVDEPLAQDSLQAGVDLISFSGDKLLGGPQAGILAGRRDLIARLRKNPMFRALRVDKLTYQALENTLRAVVLERFQQIPALAMIMEPAERIRARAESVAKRIPGAEVVPGESVVGGGSTPAQSIQTWLIALAGDAVELEKKLRSATPPVIARIDRDRVVIDLRTVLPSDEDDLVQALSK